MLFVELAVIRWSGANVVYLAYFSNLVLLGSFLGIGLGFLWAGRGGRPLFPFAPVVLAAVRGVHPPGADRHQRVGQPAHLLQRAHHLGPAPRGDPPGHLRHGRHPADVHHRRRRPTFKKLEPLEAYKFDLIGSALGIVGVSVLSFLGMPPGGVGRRRRRRADGGVAAQGAGRHRARRPRRGGDARHRVGRRATPGGRPTTRSSRADDAQRRLHASRSTRSPTRPRCPSSTTRSTARTTPQAAGADADGRAHHRRRRRQRRGRRAAERRRPRRRRRDRPQALRAGPRRPPRPALRRRARRRAHRRRPRLPRAQRQGVGPHPAGPARLADPRHRARRRCGWRATCSPRRPSSRPATTSPRAACSRCTTTTARAGWSTATPARSTQVFGQAAVHRDPSPRPTRPTTRTSPSSPCPRTPPPSPATATARPCGTRPADAPGAVARRPPVPLPAQRLDARLLRRHHRADPAGVAARHPRRRRAGAPDAPLHRPVLHGRGVHAARDEERGAVRACSSAPRGSSTPWCSSA